MVPRLDMFRSILSLSKTAHQMWHHHPFSQRNRATETTVGIGVWRQGLIQKEKVHINCEKGAQINILANKTATQ